MENGDSESPSPARDITHASIERTIVWELNDARSDRRWTANSIAFGGKFHVPAEQE